MTTKTNTDKTPGRTLEHLRAVDAITNAQIDLGRAKFILENWLDNFGWPEVDQLDPDKVFKWLTGFKDTQTSIFIILDYVFKALQTLEAIEPVND